MPNYCKVVLIGHLTRDVEVRTVGSGTTVGSFAVAYTHKYKAANGEKREDVSFIDCTAWGRTAEVIAQYMGKGSAILVEGRLKQDSWEDKTTGAKRSKLGLVVDSFEFIPKSDGGKKDDKPQAKSKSAESGKLPTKGSGSMPSVIDDEDIPFSM